MLEATFASTGRDDESGSGAFGRSPGGHVRPRRSHPSLLVVDDDAGIREAIASALRDERFIVATAHNGRAALNLLRGGFRPAAVLLDLWMPEIDGVETLDVMKADPELAKIPVIVITAGDQSVTEKVSAASLVMRKPLDLEELIDVVERHAGVSNI